MKQKYIIVLLVLTLSAINAKSQSIEITAPQPNSEICNLDYLSIRWNSEGVSNVNIWVTDPFNNYYSLLERNYDASVGKYDWLAPRDVYAGRAVSIKIIDVADENIFSEVTNLSLNDAPLILEQDKRIFGCYGDAVELNVRASGIGLSYKWYKDGREIVGSNTPILEFESADFEDSGEYICEISGYEGCPSVSSNPIVLYVAGETEVIDGPHDVKFNPNTTVVFAVDAQVNGTKESPITYQWYKDTTVIDVFGRTKVKSKPIEDNYRIDGAKSSVLKMQNATYLDQRAQYWCNVTGVCGETESRRARLSSLLTFELLDMTADTILCEDLPIDLEVKMLASREDGTYYYQWRREADTLHDNSNISGTKTTKLHIDELDSLHSGIYILEVMFITDNGKDTITGSTPGIDLIVKTKPRIYVDLPDKMFIYDRDKGPNRNGNARLGFDIVDGGDIQGIKVNVYRNGKLVGQPYRMHVIREYPFLKPPEPTDDAIGEWQFEFVNECGSTWSKKCIIEWGYKDIQACGGENKKVEIPFKPYESELEIKYLWYHEGKEIKNAHRYNGLDSNHIHIYDFDWNDRGKYELYAESPPGSKAKLVGKVWVEIVMPPVIERDFKDTMYLNHTSEYDPNVLMISTNAVRTYYRYYSDGATASPQYSFTNTSGDTVWTAIYMGGHTNMGGGTLLSSQMKAGKTYFVRVWNECGEVASKFVYASPQKGESKGYLTSVIGDEKLQSDLLIYPQPAEDYIVLQFGAEPSADVASVELVGISGERYDVKFHPNGNSTSYLVDIDHSLTSGVYMIIIKDTNGKIITGKIIKN